MHYSCTRGTTTWPDIHMAAGIWLGTVVSQDLTPGTAVAAETTRLSPMWAELNFYIQLFLQTSYFTLLIVAMYFFRRLYKVSRDFVGGGRTTRPYEIVFRLLLIHMLVELQPYTIDGRLPQSLTHVGGRATQSFTVNDWLPQTNTYVGGFTQSRKVLGWRLQSHINVSGATQLLWIQLLDDIPLYTLRQKCSSDYKIACCCWWILQISYRCLWRLQSQTLFWWVYCHLQLLLSLPSN